MQVAIIKQAIDEKASVHYMSVTEIQWFPCKGVYHEHFPTDFTTSKQRR